MDRDHEIDDANKFDQPFLENGANSEKDDYTREFIPVRKRSSASMDRTSEFATEVAPLPPRASLSSQERNGDIEEKEDDRANPIVGWSAILISILSLFMYPLILGVAGIVIGVVAWFRGSRALGTWAVIIGLIGMLSNMLLAPM